MAMAVGDDDVKRHEEQLAEAKAAESRAKHAKHLVDTHPLRIVHCPVKVARARAKLSQRTGRDRSIYNSNGIEIAVCFEPRVADALAELINTGADAELDKLHQVAEPPEAVVEPVKQHGGLVLIQSPTSQMYDQCSDNTLGVCLQRLADHVNTVAHALRLRGWTVDLIAHNSTAGGLATEVKRTEYLNRNRGDET